MKSASTTTKNSKPRSVRKIARRKPVVRTSPKPAPEPVLTILSDEHGERVTWRFKVGDGYPHDSTWEKIVHELIGMMARAGDCCPEILRVTMTFPG